MYSSGQTKVFPSCVRCYKEFLRWELSQKISDPYIPYSMKSNNVQPPTPLQTQPNLSFPIPPNPQTTSQPNIALFPNAQSSYFQTPSPVSSQPPSSIPPSRGIPPKSVQAPLYSNKNSSSQQPPSTQIPRTT